MSAMLMLSYADTLLTRDTIALMLLMICLALAR